MDRIQGGAPFAEGEFCEGLGIGTRFRQHLTN